jgi:hypothetical protein
VKRKKVQRTKKIALCCHLVFDPANLRDHTAFVARLISAAPKKHGLGFRVAHELHNLRVVEHHFCL